MPQRKKKADARKKSPHGPTENVAGLNISRYAEYDSGDRDGFGVRCADFRLFIFGVEVTEHCIGTITIPRQGRDGEGTLSFSLDNNYEKFVMRSANFQYTKDWQESYEHHTWNESNLSLHPRAGQVPDAPKDGFIDPDWNRHRPGLYTYTEAAKYRIYDRKRKINAENRRKYVQMLTSGQASADFAPLVDSYRLNVGSPVIHRMDHVRLWILDPLLDPAEVGSGDPDAPAALRWMPAFTGFVDGVTKSSDLMTGKSSLEIQCVDIRTVLKRKRVLVNSTASEGNLTVNPNAGAQGLYADLNMGNLGSSTNDLALLNFKQIIAKIFCKSATMADEQKFIDDHPNTEIQASSLNFRADPSKASKEDQAATEAAVKSAAQAQTDAENAKASKSMAVFQNRGMWKSIPDVIAAIRGDAITDKDNESSAKYGVGLYALGHSFKFPDMKNIKPGRNQTQDQARRAACAKFMDDWVSLTVFGVNRTWYSDAAVTQIGSQSYPGGQFSCYKGFVHYLEPAGGNGISQYMDSTLISGMGVDREFQSVYQIFTDICERVDYQFQVNGMGDIMFEPPFYDLLPTDLGGEWKYLHAVGNSVRSANVNDDTESNPVTCMKVTGGAVNEETPPVDNEHVSNFEYTIFVKSDSMTERYGFVEEDKPCPFITKATSGANMTDENSAKLAIYGILEFTKRMAAMSQIQVEAAYNPFLYPNRPYLSFYERRVGTITSSTITLEIGVSASSSVELSMLRQFDDAGVCTNLTGFQHTPFSMVNADETLDGLLSMNGSWANIRTKCGVEVYKVDDNNNITKVVGSGGQAHGAVAALPRTAAVNNALDTICKNNPGLRKQDLIGVMMQESGGSRNAKNPVSSAAGLFQMLVGDYIEAKAFAKRKGMAFPRAASPVDTSSRERFQDTFCAAYNEEQQLQIWNIRLEYIKSWRKKGDPEIKINTPGALAASNIAPGLLKRGGEKYMTEEAAAYIGRINANAASQTAQSWSANTDSSTSQSAQTGAWAGNSLDLSPKATLKGSATETATGTPQKVVRK